MQDKRYLEATTMLDFQSEKIQTLAGGRGWRELNTFNQIGAEPVFEESTLIARTLKKGIGSYGLAEVIQGIDHLKSNGELIPRSWREGNRPVKGYTTGDAEALERKTLDRVKQAQSGIRRMLSPSGVKTYAKQLQLEGSAKTAFQNAVADKERLSVIEGAERSDEAALIKALSVLSEKRGHKLKVIDIADSNSSDRLEVTGIKRLNRQSLNDLSTEKNEGGRSIWFVPNADQLSHWALNSLLFKSRLNQARIIFSAKGENGQSSGFGDPLGLVKSQSQVVKFEQVAKDKSPIRFHEVKDPSDRLSKFVDQYFKDPDRGKVALYTLDGSTQDKVNGLIRERLKAQGTITNERMVAQWREVIKERSERERVHNYRIGQWIKFPHGNSGKNSLARIVSISDSGVLQVETDQGVVSIDPRKEGTRIKAVFEIGEAAIGVGDQLFLDTDKKNKTSAKAQVSRIDGEVVKVTISDGKERSMNLRDFKHWRYGYAKDIAAAKAPEEKAAAVLVESWNHQRLNCGISARLSNGYERVGVFSENRTHTGSAMDRKRERSSSIDLASERRSSAQAKIEKGTLDTRVGRFYESAKNIIDKVRSEVELSR